MKLKTLRLIDANFNRTKEGLRVCEDVSRFVLNDRSLTGSFKRLRHDTSKTILAFPVPYRKLVSARNTAQDVGRKSIIMDQSRPRWKDLVISNLKRSEESLRVLEESSKIIAPKKAKSFQSLRFRLYGLEKKVLKRI
jgi:hypothetical protein